jgi:hypothetical protein
MFISHSSKTGSPSNEVVPVALADGTVEFVDIDLFKRVLAKHRWLEIQEEKHNKRLEDIKNGELFPDDLNNAKSDRGTHADPTAREACYNLRAWQPKRDAK